jgi:hypothetical protein
MDLVLGVSMTSRAVRWVLVEGTTGEGATVDRGTFDLVDDVDPEQLIDVLLIDEPDQRMHAVGLTWTNEAESAASGVLDALRSRGYESVIAVSELEAGDVLAAGIAGIAESEDIAVCIIEPDSAVVAVVNPDGVKVDRFSRPSDGSDVVELPSSVMAMLDLDDWHPDSIFVVGSADDLDLIRSTLEAVTDAPVFSAAEADLALARGAALASARAVNGLDTAGRPLPARRVRALTAVVAAAAVTLVASVAVALGTNLSSEPETEQAVAADNAPAPAAPPAPPTESATKVANLTESLQAARPLVAQTIVVAAPPAPEVLPALPPAAPAAPPAGTPPTYAPPPFAAPPPVPVIAPQPRLRDRILERIPIINRFHEPQYQYPN